MKLEAKAVLLVVVVAVFMFFGSYVTMVVPLTDETLYIPTADAKDYSALEMRGREIYQAEGCVYCHTQQVRNLLEETQRYGMGEEETFKRFGIRALIQAPPSQPGEFVYDKPHFLGTRRAGPDLARVGGKYDNTWHLNHFRDPRSTSPGSLMPAYTWLFDKAGQPTQEAIALVAYMQKLGTGIKWREEGVEQVKKLQAHTAETANETVAERRNDQ
ncbi:MAG: cbb3-type cytochrome c oxidase subunit II [Bacteroidetes bacterium]|nr:cbb3-type cytochrome c oxidase subunit II [Bacteroidota bacterium]MCW5894663.1 cbb3-type cytochrome c oxidase subunit II [Bacteroidota bacterium]